MNRQNDATVNQFSIFGTFVWMLFLSFGIQAILGFFAIASIKIIGRYNDVELILMRPDFIAITGIMAATLSLPLIKTAAHQSGKSFPFKFLAFDSINIATLIKVLLIGVIFYTFQSFIIHIFSIDTPQFLLDVKSQTHSNYDILMLFIGICIVAPIIEEVIFRGLIYERLVRSKIGVAGSIIVTSLVFTAIHVQYDYSVLAVLSFFSFLLGYIRYKTGNLIYCIALHMQSNILVTIELLVFL